MPLISYPDASPDMAALLQAWKLPDGVGLALEMGSVDNDETLIERCREADAILLGWAKVTRRVMEACPNLRLVSFLGIGADDYVDFAAARERGIRVANTPGYGDRTVAEHAIALLFAVSRQVPRFDALTRSGRWVQEPSGLELKGKRIGLVGFGPIAREMARMALGLGLEVVAWTRNAGKYRRNFSTVKFVDLANLFDISDVVSLHLSLNAATRGLIDAALLNRLKPGAIVINTARGGLMDYDCLEKLLEEGRLYGAGLDVFPNEPLANSGGLQSKLTTMPNVVLTPHIGFSSAAAMERMLRIALDNILGFLAGKPQNIIV
ncbi:MAG TPA: C-terminal binding protein [Dongiaceae bacterium]|nr:C-terminal binding protein [Dongiaceae bacterium]